MKRLFLLIIILAVSVWTGIELQRDPGYVLIAYRLWTVEMPVWAGLLSLIISFTVFYGVLHLLTVTGSLGNRLHSWSIRRRKHKARNLTSQGFIELAEGLWEQAEKDMLKAAPGSESPLVNYLSAACAAQELRAYERRDEYLCLAQQSTPDAEIAIGVVQAQLQLNHQQWEPALVTLRRFQALAPRHRQVLRLLKETYIHLREWALLAELLPLLRKTRAVTSAESDVLQAVVHKEMLINTVRHKDLNLIRAYWQSLPRHLQLDNTFLKIYVPVLISQQSDKEAEQLLRNALNQCWDDDLIVCYGRVNGTDPASQLAVAEIWLKEHAENPLLLLTAGRLCLRNQLWGKARHYLEFSLQLRAHPETCLLLGDLLARLSEKEASARYYHQGLQVAVEKGLMPFAISFENT